MNECKTCGVSVYGAALDCEKTEARMLVDTCPTARGHRGRGYCAAHPSLSAIDFGEAFRTRAQAARAYAAAGWHCPEADVRVRKLAGYGGCRYIAARDAI